MAAKALAIADPAPPPRSAQTTGAKAAELAVPLAVLAIVLAMVAPLPAFLLDILIATNITLSVVVLLVAMYILRPVEFSVFPTTLLLLTLFRLGLNISSARLILLNGNTGTTAAGHVIEAFGTFVVGGNYIVGVVIFLVLIAIQYVVINHGAVRISEVTARFTLDAMPGKQMSIDSDLNAGLIDEPEARARRRQLAAEAEFYGAMDGASRFTQRDAVASILITAINIIAGFLIGVLQHGMDLRRAIETYTVLTIGDGLVTVLPALMISISGGLVVTRAGADARLGAQVRKQVFGNAQPLLMASGVLFALAAFPGLPKVPFLTMGAGIGVLAWRMRQKVASAEKASLAQTPAVPKENLESLLRVEPMCVEVGLGLVRLVEGGQNSPLLRRIAAIRRQLATELGYLLPPVRVTDNLSLHSREYVILLKGAEVSRFDMPQGCELAIHPGRPTTPLDGLPTKEPAFGIPAVWIRPEQLEAARAAGYTVVDPTGILGTHLSEIVRRYAHELLSRQDTKRLLDRVAEEHPRVVEDLVPKLLPLAAVQRVLQNLLRERVSIRDSVSILESLAEAASITKNPLLLTEYVRQAIRRVVVKPYLNSSGDLPAYFLDASLEQMVESSVEHGEFSSHWNLSPQAIREVLDRIRRVAGNPEAPAAAIASSGARPFLRQLAESSLPNLYFISHSEIPPGVKVVSLGVVQ
ncbi:MAG: flagellar biosynthesis protein FlhA [Bryobacteraceae bacterium]